MTTDERLEQLEKLVREGFQQMAAMQQQIADLRHDVADIKSEVVDIKSFLLEFRTEVILRFDQVEGRVDMLSLTMQSLDTRVPGLTKAVIDMQVRLGKLERPAA